MLDDTKRRDAADVPEWRKLAEQICKETDEEKLLQKAQKLCDVLDEQFPGSKGKREPHPVSPKRPQ